jgi:FixJ family two-component response regulator
VDDDDDVRESTQFWLETKGYAVETFKSVAAILEDVAASGLSGCQSVSKRGPIGVQKGL